MNIRRSFDGFLLRQVGTLHVCGQVGRAGGDSRDARRVRRRYTPWERRRINSNSSHVTVVASSERVTELLAKTAACVIQTPTYTILLGASLSNSHRLSQDHASTFSDVGCRNPRNPRPIRLVMCAVISPTCSRSALVGV